MVIVLSTLILGRERVKLGIEFTSDLNVLSSCVLEVVSGGDETNRQSTGTSGVSSGLETESNSRFFRISNGIDINLATIVSHTTGAGRQEDTEVGLAVNSSSQTVVVGEIGGSSGNTGRSSCLCCGVSLGGSLLGRSGGVGLGGGLLGRGSGRLFTGGGLFGSGLFSAGLLGSGLLGGFLGGLLGSLFGGSLLGGLDARARLLDTDNRTLSEVGTLGIDGGVQRNQLGSTN